MAFPRRPAAGGLASGGGHHSALSPLSTCVHSHSSPAAPPTACAVHSMRDEVRDARDAVRSLCACSTASAISSHWSVDHGRAARRCSPCGLGLVCVQSGERHLHLFPCGPSTIVVQLGDARHAVQGSCVCSPTRAISSPAVRRPWHAVWGRSPCGSGLVHVNPTSVCARQSPASVRAQKRLYHNIQKEDSLVWKMDSSGIYSSQSLYAALNFCMCCYACLYPGSMAASCSPYAACVPLAVAGSSS